MNQSDSSAVQNQKAAWNLPGRYGSFRAPINAMSRFDRRTTLYVLGDDGPLIKVGIAQNLEKRLAQFRLGNPRIRVLAFRTMPAALDRQIERLVHEALAQHAHGREWFTCSSKEALAVAKPILERGWRAYNNMAIDGLFGGAAL